jgi:hypothetical protein
MLEALGTPIIPAQGALPLSRHDQHTTFFGESRLSFAGTCIADASVTPTALQCAQARAALASLQEQADAEKNPTRKEILKKMIAGASPTVNGQCP